MRSSKNLTHLTTLRLSPNLRDEAERHARFRGMNFSDFVRKSINRNIDLSREAEEEIIKRTSHLRTEEQK